MADKPSGRALTVEQVLEREEKRFEERAERARKELAEAEEARRSMAKTRASRRTGAANSTRHGGAATSRFVGTPQPTVEPVSIAAPTRGRCRRSGSAARTHMGATYPPRRDGGTAAGRVGDAVCLCFGRVRILDVDDLPQKARFLDEPDCDQVPRVHHWHRTDFTRVASRNCPTITGVPVASPELLLVVEARSPDALRRLGDQARVRHLPLDAPLLHHGH
jgi:hypothetical protein